MKFKCFKPLTALCLFLFLGADIFAGVSVIVHPDNPNTTLEAKDLQKIFLGKTKKFPSGDKVVPIDLSQDSQTKAAFYEGIIKKKMSQLTAYWSKLIFTGKAQPPKAVSSEEEAIKYVSENPDAIAYVDSSKVTDKVKVIYQY